MQRKLQYLVCAHSFISKYFSLSSSSVVSMLVFFEAQHFRVKISFFTMNNPYPLSLPFFLYSSKIHILNFAALFPSKHIQKGKNVLLNSSWKAYFFTLDRFFISLVITQTLFLCCSVLPGSFQSQDGQASFLAVTRPQLMPSEGLVGTLFSWGTTESHTSPISQRVQSQRNKTAPFLRSNLPHAYSKQTKSPWEKSVWTWSAPWFQTPACCIQ